MGITWIILALLLLCILIFVHELGHFLAGKALGFGINEFAIGFGPKLLSRVGKDGVRYSIRLLPLGGFCAFLDEEATGENSRSFNKQAAWKRFIVQIAGAGFNIIFALLLAITFCGLFGMPGNRAEVAQKGFSMKIQRNGQEQEVYIQDPYDRKLARNWLGIYFTVHMETLGVAGSVRAGAAMTGRFSTEILKAIGSLFMQPAEIGQQMTGPIGTVSVMGSMLQEGFVDESAKVRSSETGTTIQKPKIDVRMGMGSLLLLSVLLSVNLGVFNLLPLPALDGGRLVFTLIEMIFRRPIPQNIQAAINMLGFALFIVLAVYLSVNDVGRLVTP